MAGSVTLHLGAWQDTLAGVEVDAVICDPPYGARTHAGSARVITDAADGANRRTLTYAHLTPEQVQAFVADWSPRCHGWMAALTSDDLIPVWRDAYAAAGRLDFAPVPVLQDRVRICGDGPACGAVYLMVARPRRREFASWGALPGWYRAGTDRGGHIGGKPLSLMQRLVADYTRHGQLVADPFAGGGTTLVAALRLGRRAIGSEIDPATHAVAAAAIERELRQPMLLDAAAPVQGDLSDLALSARLR